jgi:HPt (histidine-containing phosphotransfer) domain-containing protein
VSLINVAYIEEISDGSIEIITEMVNIFKSQVGEFASEMKDLLRKGNHYDLGLLAHKAKSSVAIMGMENLAVKLKELEIKAKEGSDPDSYAKYIANFENETILAVKELDSYIDTLDQ